MKGMHSFSSFLQGATFHSAIKIAESGGIKTETPEQTVTAPLYGCIAAVRVPAKNSLQFCTNLITQCFCDKLGIVTLSSSAMNSQFSPLFPP